MVMLRPLSDSSESIRLSLVKVCVGTLTEVLRRGRYRYNRAPHLFLGAFVPTKFTQTGFNLFPPSTEAGAPSPTISAESAPERGSSSGEESGDGGGTTASTLLGHITKMDASTGSLSVGGGTGGPALAGPAASVFTGRSNHGSVSSAAGNSDAGSAGNRSLYPPASATGAGGTKKEKRTLIGFLCATAGAAYTARAITLHDDSEDAHLVCIHSIVMGRIWRGRRIGRTMVEHFLERIRDTETASGSSTAHGNGGHGSSSGVLSAHASGATTPTHGAPVVVRKRGYETAACIAHEESAPFLKACGFKTLGHSHVQYGSGDWIEFRREIVPEKMRKQLSGDWAKDDAERQMREREEERIWEEKKSADRKASVAQYLQQTQTQQQEGEPMEQMLHGSPTDMDAPQTDSVSRPQSASRSNTGSSFSPTPSEGQTTSPPSGLSTSMLLAALRSQSTQAAQSSQRNPGQSYSAILGSAMAGKTFHEDAFSALEARLVSRDLGTNLGDLYCPREECGCKVMGVDRGMWEVREVGPLAETANPADALPNSPPPPMHPSPVVPPSQARVSTANGPSFATTPGQAFWVVPTPLAFDNISFSKDAKWRPVNPGALVTSPRAEDYTPRELSKEERKQEQKDQRERDKREKAERKATLKAAKRQNSVHLLSTAGTHDTLTPSNAGGTTTENGSPSSPNALSPQRSRSDGSDHGQTETSAAPEFTVKYLLCAECDCGPLGYSILPQSLAGGGLAHQVGQEINSANGAGGGQMEENVPRQEFLIAADRVRYRFNRN